MQLEAERSAGRSGDAPVAGSVRGALAASLSRAPFGEAQSWPRKPSGPTLPVTRRRRYSQRHVVPEQLHRYGAAASHALCWFTSGGHQSAVSEGRFGKRPSLTCRIFASKARVAAAEFDQLHGRKSWRSSRSQRTKRHNVFDWLKSTSESELLRLEQLLKTRIVTQWVPHGIETKIVDSVGFWTESEELLDLP